MKILNKLALLIAFLAIMVSAGCTTSSSATGSIDNWTSGEGSIIWRSGDGSLCWQNGNWTPETAASIECGKPAAELVTADAPIVPLPPLVPPKTSHSADAFFDFDKVTLKLAGRQALDGLLHRLGGIEAIFQQDIPIQQALRRIISSFQSAAHKLSKPTWLSVVSQVTSLMPKKKVKRNLLLITAHAKAVHKTAALKLKLSEDNWSGQLDIKMQSFLF